MATTEQKPNLYSLYNKQYDFDEFQRVNETKSEDEIKIINVKRSIAKGLFSKKDHFATLKVDELSDFVITSLKFLYKNDLNYVLKLGLSKEVVDEISK